MEQSIAAGSEERTINLLGLRLPWKTSLVIVLTTLLITFDWYYNILSEFVSTPSFGAGLINSAVDRMLLYFVIPILIILFLFRERPSDYGLTIGDWRAGIKWTLAAWVMASPVLYLSARTPAMMDFYARYNQPALELIATTALDLFSWEFLFRGFILFALYRVAGPSAVLLQAVPFALAHLTKPPLETLSTIFGGTAFGWVAWRTRSFLYAFLIHLYVMVFVALIANLP